MKTRTVASWSLTSAVGVLLIACGCVRESVNSAPAIVTNQDPTAFSEAAVTPVEEAAPQVVAEDLDNAPAKLVSTPAAVVPTVSLSSSATEVARLAQSGVDENVMLAFVNNSAGAFDVGSDQIIYLNDIGVPGNVVTAMIQRDQALKNSSGASLAPAPVYSPPPAPVQTVAPEAVAAPSAPVLAQDAPSPDVNVTATYFNDALSPYGNWLEVEGYGRCWQPSVVVVDRGWTPYCDRGHWVYSDCGWYWASDYSWGWAPFHYGRWFRHNIWGWCWAPDTVWGPSWVSWRYNSGYCGWAPLPPTACYQPGLGFSYHGRSVGVSFGFGLAANCFTFVAANRFCDPQPFRHRLPHQQVTQIFNNTVIINPVAEDRNNPRYHRGIPPKHITEITHTEIKPVKIRETLGGPGRGLLEDRDHSRGTLTVFRPVLPQPPAHTAGKIIGEGIKPATPDTVVRRFDSEATMHRGIPQKTPSSTPANIKSQERRGDAVPVYTAPTTVNNQPRNLRETEKTPLPLNKQEISSGTSDLRGSAVTSKSPPVQNSLLLKRQPIVAAPQQIVSPTPEQIQPNRSVSPVVRDGMQRGQPRQEKVFTAPVTAPAPMKIQPEMRTYQAPAPVVFPQVVPREPRGDYNPVPARAVPARVPEWTAPPAARVVAPQLTLPRVEAPRVEARPPAAVQTPPAPVQRPASNNGGGSREKRQDNGNPRLNK